MSEKPSKPLKVTEDEPEPQRDVSKQEPEQLKPEEVRQGEVVFDSPQKRRRFLYYLAALVAIAILFLVLVVPW